MTENHIVENTDIEYCSSIINKPIPIRVDFKISEVHVKNIII